jgi:hypothetical protein
LTFSPVIKVHETNLIKKRYESLKGGSVNIIKEIGIERVKVLVSSIWAYLLCGEETGVLLPYKEFLQMNFEEFRDLVIGVVEVAKYRSDLHKKEMDKQRKSLR